ncbi:GNAT family N-acetyltransferase [Murinocardiopsis flavida]|uniref:GNAT family N-acetyltransferase n=1 Tax=Murinocardiopsis flavida TaxID=645275 RepID=UPI001472DC57|nr:GNAT family N-acetyltransferase [Murinocardiopsis flavida]
MKLRKEAEGWLHDRGVRQWLPEWSDRSYELIERNIYDGKTWVVSDDESVVATVTLNGPDLDFWNESDQLDEAIYFYKLIVRRDHGGTGLGVAIIDWVSLRAERQGKKWVRLDCWRDNVRLQEYYQQRGFTHVRTEHRAHRESGALFQRPAGKIEDKNEVLVVSK